MAKRSARVAEDSSGEVWIRMGTCTRNYYISRHSIVAGELIDDEAQLEITGMPRLRLN